MGVGGWVGVVEKRFRGNEVRRQKIYWTKKLESGFELELISTSNLKLDV